MHLKEMSTRSPISDKKYSPTGKRFDMTVTVKPLIANKWSFPLRIMAYTEVTESEVKKMVEVVVEGKKSWKARANYNESYTFPLRKWNANAFINPNAKKKAIDNPIKEEE